ncbi:MAG: NADH-quinone oxidoreductase subunit J family protein [Gemmatimonadales bacterium]
MAPGEIAFWVFSGIAVVGAVLCITQRNPVKSALWLVLTLFAIAALFVLLEAQFIATLQVLVYAGAIMVLFLFVIMLLNLGRGRPSDRRGGGGAVVAAGLGALLLLQLGALRTGAIPLPETYRLPAGALTALQQREGVVGAVARPLFGEYLIPFEITSVLLLAAIVGAVVLAKRRL